MKILALDCSAGPASVAVLADGNIIASSFVNVKLTHSQTLLPMVKNTLDSALLTLEDIDAFAINNGPGSFTGIRIGISAVNGLASPSNKPCAQISTLESIAYLFKNTDCIVCSVMDARCNQVYNALFRVKDTKVTRLCDDRAVLADEVIKELDLIDEKVIIAGDGAKLFEQFAKSKTNILIAQEPLRYQNACGVALSAQEKILKENTVKPSELSPFYLRLPQAERELKAKREQGE